MFGGSFSSLFSELGNGIIYQKIMRDRKNNRLSKLLETLPGPASSGILFVCAGKSVMSSAYLLGMNQIHQSHSDFSDGDRLGVDRLGIIYAGAGGGSC